MSLRLWLRHRLFTATSRWGRGFNFLIAWLILSSVSVLLILATPLMDDLARNYRALYIYEVCVTVFFTIEYCLRIYAARRPMSYIFSWHGIVDFLSSFPVLLAEIGVLPANAIYLLMVRFVRIFKLVNTFSEERQELLQDLSRRTEIVQLQDEVVERVVTKHPIIFFLSIFAPLFLILGAISLVAFFPLWGQGLLSVINLIAVSILLLISLLLFFRSWLDFHFDLIYISNYRLILQNRTLFGRTARDFSYIDISTINPDTTSPIGWLLGYGHISFETASIEHHYFSYAQKPERAVHHVVKNRQLVHARREAGGKAGTPIRPAPEAARLARDIEPDLHSTPVSNEEIQKRQRNIMNWIKKH